MQKSLSEHSNTLSKAVEDLGFQEQRRSCRALHGFSYTFCYDTRFQRSQIATTSNYKLDYVLSRANNSYKHQHQREHLRLLQDSSHRPCKCMDIRLCHLLIIRLIELIR